MENIDYDDIKIEKIRQGIKDKGYKEIENEYIHKFLSLFKQMLAYKKINYNDNWTFQEFVDQIDTHYHYYHDELRETFFDDLETSEIQRIMRFDALYNLLMEEENDYKKYAYYYNVYELKTGETYKDLYNKQKEKFVELFKEMLDYVDCDYNKENDNFDYLKSMVIDFYPFYMDKLIHLDVMMFSPSATYIQLLNSMERIYNSLSKNYKNREKLLEEYEVSQEFDWIE